MDIQKIQQYMIEHDLDGWLLADFHARNNIAVSLLKLDGIITRRSFFLIPSEGEPTALVHAVETDKFAHLPGRIIQYSGYKQLESELRTLVSGQGRLAMEYSPKGRLPYVGLVEAGTIELVRDMGVEIVTSADIVAAFQAILSVEQIATHRMAAHNLLEIKDAAFCFVKERLDSSEKVSEFDVVSFILSEFDRVDMTTSHAPICAVNANAGNPHYEPTSEKSSLIKKGDLILIDLWARIKQENSIFGDITWMAFAGSRAEIPEKFVKLFKIIVAGRDAAVNYLREKIDSRPVRGSEVDDACRKVIDDSGYGEFFVHRTGHSITTTEHGTGPNIDNLETEDNRRLRQGHLFSIEPGIYMNDCGFRTEINVLISHTGAEITTLPVQEEIVCLY